MILNLIIFSVLASLSNSTSDAMKFSGVEQTYWLDWSWHILKWCINKPLMLFAGYNLGKYIEAKGYKYFLDIFHWKKEHFILLGITILNIGVWQANYHLALIYIPKIF